MCYFTPPFLLCFYHIEVLGGDVHLSTGVGHRTVISINALGSLEFVKVSCEETKYARWENGWGVGAYIVPPTLGGAIVHTCTSA